MKNNRFPIVLSLIVPFVTVVFVMFLDARIVTGRDTTDVQIESRTNHYSLTYLPKKVSLQSSSVITISPISALTTTEGGGTDSFTVVLVSQPASDVTIGISSSDTTEGTVSTSSVIFTVDNWETAQTVTITGVNDDVYDGDVPYTIITAPAASDDSTYSGEDADDVSVTNTDDEIPPTIEFTTVEQTVDESIGTATITAELSAISGLDVSVPFILSGTANEGTDYSTSDNPLVIPAGSQSADITITITDDLIDEASETVVVTMDTPTNASLGSQTTHTLTITDNDVPPTVEFTTVEQTVDEGIGTATITTELSTISGLDVSVPFILSGSAILGTDYSTSANPLVIPAGSQSADITITITDDSIDEDSETITITMDSPTNAGLGDETVHTVTITDNDLPPVLSIGNASVTEENVDVEFTVTLSPASEKTVTVNYATSDGSAKAPGDYLPISSSTLTFNPGETSRTITVQVNGDNIDEENETFNVTLSNPGNAALDPAKKVGVGTIIDDDAWGITIVPTEGLQTHESGTSDTFTIKLNSEPTADVTFPLSSSEPSEGTVSPSSITFTPLNWSQTQTVTVTGVDDLVADGNQDYEIIIGQSTSADPKYDNEIRTVSVTNADNDSAGITLTPSSGLVTKESGGQATLKVILNTKPTDDVTVNFNSSDPSEGVVSAFNYTFTPDNWNESFTLIVTGVDDTLLDGDVNYQINLSTTSSDPKYHALNRSVSAVNIDAPNIDWMKPVETEKVYAFDGLGPLLLETVNAGDEDVVLVRFYRWDHVNLQHITIAEVNADGSGQFNTSIDTATLYPGYNQVFAFAFNSKGFTSPHVRILLLRQDGAVYKLYLPEVSKRP